MKVSRKAILVILIAAIFSGPLSADVIAVKTTARAPEKGYFSLDSRRAKVAGQQEEQFKEERPMPVAQTLGFLLLATVAITIGMFAHNN